MPGPKTPKKEKSTEAKTAQSGMYSGLDYVGKKFITPKKGVSDEENYDEENLVSVEAEPVTKEEGEIAARQEKFVKGIITAKGGKKRRRSLKKTKKVKKHRKQK
jgi:hypothetical protein